MTAYRWIPWLTRTTPFDRPSVGDPFVTASSPRVEVTITSDRPATFARAASRRPQPRAASLSWPRTCATSISVPVPTTRRPAAPSRGTQITFFHRTMSADAVLDVAARAFDHFSERIGAYPYAQLAIAEIGPWAPLESPSLFWLPNNAPRRLLPWMTAHETAHQWFYSVVGNDQAREPFADEAITDFIARDLIDRFVASQCPPGKLDRTIYQLGECYPWVIYVQGDAFLRDLRDGSRQCRLLPGPGRLLRRPSIRTGRHARRSRRRSMQPPVDRPTTPPVPDALPACVSLPTDGI